MTIPRWLAVPAVAALLGWAGPLPAADLKALAAHPPKIGLRGLDDASQLVLTATRTDNRLQDRTGDAKYESANTKVARVSTSGRVVPVGNGETTISATVGDKIVQVAVRVEKCDVNLPINFANQIVPIFSKLGCNSGGCHGKASGQNGFRLSLLGFEPDLDYQTLVKEGRGRRLLTTAPERSLLLQKATGAMAHGGGKKMEPGSDEYKLVRRWIAAGTPWGSEKDPVVTRISVVPDHRILPRDSQQQFAVYAHYNDGSTEDITRRAQYESNDQEIAVVETSALVRTLSMSGEAAIMARYQGHVATFRATVPLGVKTPDWAFEPKTLVDKFTSKKWKELGLVPSKVCSDEQFIRRVSLDLTGTLPTPTQVAEFVADTDEAKRDKLVDRLIETPEYAFYFAGKWADVLRVKRGQNQPNGAKGTFAFHDWIRRSLTDDKRYDEFAREILAATGDEVSNPPTVWYKNLPNPENFVDDTAQVFLGVRMACAQCHHHPYEKWSQDDYWGLAAYSGRLGRKNVIVPSESFNGTVTRQVIFNRSGGAVNNKRTGRPADVKPLDGEVVKVEAGDDPRHKLVDWMVDAKNPFFAKAVANRYWAHFLGRGIVDPIDDMRVTNPPSNPELLDALAKDFVEHKYSLKHLVKAIAKSRTYQLASEPNEFNKHDKQNYARYYPRRMSAEVLFDAVCQVTASPGQFGGLPRDRNAPNRAIMLPDESFASYFLDVFGRPQRLSACECERVSEANLAQALHLLNSDEVQGKLSRGDGRADLLAKDSRPDEAKVDELFVWALGRKPDAGQKDLAMKHLAKHAQNKKLAYENILWALLNTKEFIFNQ